MQNDSYSSWSAVMVQSGEYTMTRLAMGTLRSISRGSGFVAQASTVWGLVFKVGV